MELTSRQLDGLHIAISRYEANEPYTVIAGYAGTGKTTLVNAIVQALKNEAEFSFASYTGKAASVLARKGNKGATTLHKLLYDCFPRPDGTFAYVQKPEIEADIVVVDECSMVPQTMVNQLLNYGKYIIFCGDPAQLSPVIDKDDKTGNKEDVNHLLDNPHVFLDEIMRQATESDIINVSMKIRNGERLPCPYLGNDIRILDASVMTPEDLFAYFNWGDEIIVGTNRSRQAINEAMRAYYGKEGKPQDGDKVICTHNNWDALSNNENPLTNGTIGYIKNYYESFRKFKIPGHRIGTTYQRPTHINEVYSAFSFVTDFNDQFTHICADKKLLESYTPSISPNDCYWIRRDNSNPPLFDAFEYGYAITCHKAQGSEWDKIVIVEERFPFEKDEHIRWLYTAVTRASSRCVILRNFNASQLLQ